MSTNLIPVIYVCIYGERPRLAGARLDSLQEAVQEIYFEHLSREVYEAKWIDYRPGEWRLMSRLIASKKRFSWSGYGIHAVRALV